MGISIEIEQKIVQVYGGWKKFAQFIRDNIPSPYECANVATLPPGGPIGWFFDFGKAKCGYKPEADCRRVQNLKNAIAFLKASGITEDEAEDVLYALRDMGWCKIFKCNALIFKNLET